MSINTRLFITIKKQKIITEFLALRLRGPSNSTLFNKAGILTQHKDISDKFSTFEVKINKKLPVEKFSERIIINKPDALIAPSFASSTGTISVVFSGKLRKIL